MRRLTLALGALAAVVWLGLFFSGHGEGAWGLGILGMVLIGLGLGIPREA